MRTFGTVSAKSIETHRSERTGEPARSAAHHVYVLQWIDGRRARHLGMAACLVALGACDFGKDPPSENDSEGETEGDSPPDAPDGDDDDDDDDDDDAGPDDGEPGGDDGTDGGPEDEDTGGSARRGERLLLGPRDAELR